MPISGSAYVNYNAAAGAFPGDTVFTEAAGTRNVLINYANGSGSSRSLSYRNGVSQIASVAIEAKPTGKHGFKDSFSSNYRRGPALVGLSN
jgi:hypothetical protein